MNLVLLFVVLLAFSVNTEGSECKVDSDCSHNKLCVAGDCILSNHRSGSVVITDENQDEPCSPECSDDQNCVAGVCVKEN